MPHETAAPALWIAYALVKWIAYIAWCRLGVRLFRADASRPWLLALGLGTLRLFLGIGFGFVILLAVNVLAEATRASGTGGSLLLYLAVYVPTRWLEWTLLFALTKRDVSLEGGLLGEHAIDRMWRAGGILLSCLADIPIIVGMGGLPLGRFFC